MGEGQESADLRIDCAEQSVMRSVSPQETPRRVELSVGRQAVSALAQKFGTPLYAYDGDVMRAQLAVLRDAVGAVGESGRAAGFRQCPRWGQASLVHQEGCDLCTSCSYSRCA